MHGPLDAGGLAGAGEAVDIQDAVGIACLWSMDTYRVVKSDILIYTEIC